MPSGTMFDGDAEDTEAALMAATYEALCKHGYADLTIEKIGEEFDKSTSLLYHHYDGKDDLLLDFLEYLLDRFEADVPLEGYETTAARLRALTDHLVPPEIEPPYSNVVGAIIELRAQAVHNAEFREHFTRTDRFFRERIEGIVREGVESGEFRDADPEQVAEFLFSTFHGAMLRRVTAEENGGTAAVRAELETYIEEYLLREN